MNKSDFVDGLSKELGKSKAETARLLDSVLKHVVNTVTQNDELQFIGFGTFKKKDIAERKVRTPKGTVAKVRAQKRISFTVGKEFKRIVNGE
ncbi:HU family DNA-binding protein [Candidatus Cyrtobacter comes]|uniref:HU family DNA-binding protein n=1 Tax=Candidatus Cyrtobacter comes TaxID=675776 RepID=A0ABU5L6D9_9RICK|nr:HU family DNA-binding protein [Candidatus Cyrtobacter comes]MDZ5761685.1 HU family DNA-binding protein [Candidatus Cyrtobacter comes]